jgi:hypothetical protein
VALPGKAAAAGDAQPEEAVVGAVPLPGQLDDAVPLPGQVGEEAVKAATYSLEAAKVDPEVAGSAPSCFFETLQTTLPNNYNYVYLFIYLFIFNCSEARSSACRSG